MNSLGKLAVAVILLLPTMALAQYGDGGYDASTSVGQQNTAYAAAPKTSGTEWQYVKKYYWHCGRQYYTWERVAVPAAPPVTNVNNPIGAVNTDNSVTHSYTYNITYSQMPGAQGSTQYGYPDSVAPGQTYNNLDLGAVFDGIIRASSQMSSDGANILEQTTATLDRTTDRFARVAEIQAKGQELRSVLNGNAEVLKASAVYAQSLAGNQLQYNHTVTRGDGRRVEVGDPNQPQRPGAGPEPPPATDNQGLAPVQAIFDRRCVQCHNEAKKSGGLSLANASKLSGQDVENILDRVSTTDPKRIMPSPNPDGSPNEPLSAADKKVLFRAAQ